GEGDVVIDLFDPNTPVDVKQQANKVVVRFLGNKIPQNLVKRLNVNDFATPVSTIDISNDGGSGVIKITGSDSFDYMAYQAENKLVISLRNKADKTTTNKVALTKTYSGKKISVDFQDIEVRRVIQLLADFTGLNIAAADNVQGNITLRLKDVPWDQALDVVLKAKGLGQRRNGNVVWIAPNADIIKVEKEEAEAYAQNLKLAPLQTAFIQLNYAIAADIEKIIRPNNRLTGTTRSNSSSANSNTTTAESVIDTNSSDALLSSRGTVAVDTRTNTLIIHDTASKIEQIKRLIEKLDIPVRQVMIEARIVRATKDLSKSMGIKWGFLSNGSTSVASNTDNLMTQWNNKYNGEDDIITDNLSVDLGASSSSSTVSSIAFGLINTADNLLTLELSALQEDGLAEVVSTPKVMTGDKQKALISSGTKIPYQSSSSNSGTNTTFQDANLSLEVTPSITPDGNVQMQLKISKDSVGTLTDAGYIIDTNAVETNLLVDNGETIVLGGIYENTHASSTSKVPLLGDIPYLGWLFKNKTVTDSKQELLIFITPRIVNDTVSRNH
ncbi:MAG: type IV pilus secretin PilQ, partial [Acinetobacter sp.]